MTFMLWIKLILILVLISIFTYLVHNNVTDKDEWSKTVTIVGAAVGALSLLWAAFTYYDSAHRAKELSAIGIYQEHVKTTIDPNNRDFLLGGKFAGMDPEAISEGDIEYERYEWYVGHALFSFEAILEVASEDYGWNKTITGFIRGHRKYMASGRFPRERYNAKLQNLVKNTLEGADTED